MSTNRILVAFASKYGATREIAEKVGAVLEQSGFVVDVLPADNAGEIREYQAVVLGSAVYAGSWRKEAVQFLTNNEASLAQRPVWLFSSGPTGEGDPVELMKGWNFPEAQKPIAERIQPRDIVFFHGDIDTRKLNFAEKLLVKGIKAPTGDFRDWESITSWAEGIAETLRQTVNAD
jgi:menaquinone-dependent protoporphyrinogen oxidase